MLSLERTWSCEFPESRRLNARLMLTVPRYDKNATDSPLLRLPPELRNRIWSLVLGGKTIHVEFSFRPRPKRLVICHHVCKSALNERNFALSLKTNFGRDENYENSFALRHSQCFGAVDDENRDLNRLHLGVLQVCRQIHKEAALLPYKENTFAFQTMRDMEPFLKALFPAQAHAISRMVVDTTFAYFLTTNAHATKTYARLMQTRLRGLSDLAVIFNGYEFDDKNFALHLGRDRLRDWEAALMQFATSPLSTVVIAFHDNFSLHPAPAFGDPSSPSYNIAREWMKKMEQKLVAGKEDSSS